MYRTCTFKWKPFVFSILLSLTVGGLAGILTMKHTQIYDTLVKPALAPPAVIFPIVWTILFFLMGVCAYFAFICGSPYKRNTLLLYAIQLGLNFTWTLVFFIGKAYLLSFLILILLWLLLIALQILFFRIKKIAGFLWLPYLLWVSFAAYLNLSIVILN